jgi:hypothetical protein
MVQDSSVMGVSGSGIAEGCGMKSWGGISDWGVDLSSISDWSCVNFCDNWGSMYFSDNSWGRSVDNSVESVNIISGVSNSSDSTIGLDKGVLSLNNISISGLGSGLRVSGKSIGYGISVVVLRVWVEWLRAGGDDSFGDNWRSGVCYWGMDFSNWRSIGHWGMSISPIWGSSISWSSNDSGRSHTHEGEQGYNLDHLGAS